MTSFRFLLGVLLLLFLGIAADSSYVPRRELEVFYRGCKALLVPGSECVPGDSRRLRLWIGAPPDARIEIRADKERIVPVRKGDGQAFSVALPEGAGRLYVLAETPDGERSWSLPLADRQGASHDILGEVQGKSPDLRRQVENRQLAALRRTLDGLRLPPKAPAEALYIVSLHRSMLAEREGDYRSALAEIHQAVEITQRLEMSGSLSTARHQLALLLLGLGRSGESARLFDELRQTADSLDSCGKADLFNNQAWSTLLAREAGEEFADPTHLLEQTIEIYEACDALTPAKRTNTLINLALAHLQEGRLPQAEALLAEAWDPDLPIPQKLWWLDLNARIALRERRPLDALRRFNELQELAVTTGSPDGRLRAAFGKALSQEALGEWTAALETLRDAEILLDQQSLQIPLHEGRETFMATRQALVNLHVDLLLRQGQTARALAVARQSRSRMLRQMERGDLMASVTPERRAAWESFAADYEKKRAHLEERARDEWKLPKDRVERDRAARTAAAQALQKELDKAFLAFGSLGDSPGEEPPPDPGELILAYHPVPDGWVGFAADEGGIATHRFKLSQESLSRPAELAGQLLNPFRAAIQRARRIRILPSGLLESVDFHALPFAEDVLLASSPVVYGLDLPVSARPERSPGRHALLVADPREDLPGALRESQEIGRILKSGSPPWRTEELKHKAASPNAVLRGFATADLLHYAGHGTFSGFGGWESGLLLAEETRLTLGDILTLRQQVPPWVVLSGCETGRSSNETPVESLGLAHAFLLAGSRAVVASTRKTNDRAVPPEFFADLYRQWDREPDLAVALQRAQLSWRQRNPKADWQAFRLFEP
ncbi:MAG TPA: CHAT domain-containing protein [Thermoanaerobaculia bacterium]